MTSEQEPKEKTDREIELLWGTDAAPRRGPKPKMTRSAVVDAAVGVADAEGLENVSMQRVAKELGYTTMSLYRYVDSKEELLLLMMDSVQTEAPPAPASDWRTGVETWFHEVVAMYRRHPWAVYVPATPPRGPNTLRWMEAGLRELSASGLHLGEALQTLLLLTSMGRDMLRMELETGGAAMVDGTAEQEEEASWARGLLAVVDEDTYPTLRRLLTASFEEQWWDEDNGTMEEDLLFPLQRLLDGIESYVRRQRAQEANEATS